jgi:hypothetical protein
VGRPTTFRCLRFVQPTGAVRSPSSSSLTSLISLAAMSEVEVGRGSDRRWVGWWAEAAGIEVSRRPPVVVKAGGDGGSTGRRLGFRVSGWWRWSRPTAMLMELGFGFPRGSSVHRTMRRGFRGCRRIGGGDNTLAPPAGQGRMVGGSVTGRRSVRRCSG